MKHRIEIRNRGQIVYTKTGNDIADLSLSSCAKMLGMSTGYMGVYVDGQYLNLDSADIAHIRHGIERIMHKNEKAMDFGIDELFEL